MTDSGRFDAENYLMEIVANGLTQLRLLPAEHQADTARHFLTLLQGATGALVATGVLDRDEAASIERHVSVPLMEAGHFERVEARAEATVEMSTATEVGIGQPQPTPPLALHFDLAVDGLPGAATQARLKASDGIREAIETAAGLATQRYGGRLTAISWRTVG